MIDQAADPSQDRPQPGAGWTEADREARGVILEARKRSWRDFTIQLSLCTDARKVWGHPETTVRDGKSAAIR